MSESRLVSSVASREPTDERRVSARFDSSIVYLLDEALTHGLYGPFVKWLDSYLRDHDIPGCLVIVGFVPEQRVLARVRHLATDLPYARVDPTDEYPIFALKRHLNYPACTLLITAQASRLERMLNCDGCIVVRSREPLSRTMEAVSEILSVLTTKYLNHYSDHAPRSHDGAADDSCDADGTDSVTGCDGADERWSDRASVTGCDGADERWCDRASVTGCDGTDSVADAPFRGVDGDPFRGVGGDPFRGQTWRADDAPYDDGDDAEAPDDSMRDLCAFLLQQQRAVPTDDATVMASKDGAIARRNQHLLLDAQTRDRRDRNDGTGQRSRVPLIVNGLEASPWTKSATRECGPTAPARAF